MIETGSEYRHVVLCYSGHEFAELLLDGSLRKLIRDARQAFPEKKIELLLYQVDSYCRKTMELAVRSADEGSRIVSAEGIFVRTLIGLLSFF